MNFGYSLTLGSGSNVNIFYSIRSENRVWIVFARMIGDR